MRPTPNPLQNSRRRWLQSQAWWLATVFAPLPGWAQRSRRDGCAESSPPGYTDTPFLPGQHWRVHDLHRPQPPRVRPAALALPVGPPSDAIVLFDGRDLSEWVQLPRGGGKPVEPRWIVRDGYMEVAPGTGSLVSKRKFGDLQLHVEWCVPAEPCGSGQWRGNSGVMLMGRYEVQVLDPVDNPTYADGMAGSIYGQWPPMVNPGRTRGEWQSFDIIFEAPRFEGERLVKPAYLTLLFNGVVVHHHQQILGPVAHATIRSYEPHGPEEPLVLQDHRVPVRFRNIWVRPLRGYDQG